MSKAVYAGVDGIARKVKKMYVGAPSLENYSDKNLLPQFAQAVTDMGITITPLKDGGLHITGSVTGGSSMITIRNPFDGSALAGSMYTFSVRTDTPEASGELQVRLLNAAGGVVGLSNMAVDTQLRYANMSSSYITTVTEFAVRLGSGITYDIVIYVQLEEGSEATEFDPYGVWKDIARKVKKAYIGVGGVARQFYSADFLTYDGEYEVLQVEYEGKICDLYRLKKSGILTLNDDALFWMCGGGANGGSSSAANNYTMPTRGVGGGGGYITEGSITAGESWVVTVGAARGASSITDGTTTYSISGASGINGTSGGGGTQTGNGGTGTGKTTIPFGIASLGKHCAGGGSGKTSKRSGSETTSISVSNSTGYNGGSNGSDAPGTGGGTGGDKGGGNGGTAKAPYTGYCSAGKGGDATFYGSGGGGGGAYADEVKSTKAAKSGGSGYQGVVYILDVNGGVPA